MATNYAIIGGQRIELTEEQVSTLGIKILRDAKIYVQVTNFLQFEVFRSIVRKCELSKSPSYMDVSRADFDDKTGMIPGTYDFCVEFKDGEGFYHIGAKAPDQFSKMTTADVIYKLNEYWFYKNSSGAASAHAIVEEGAKIETSEITTTTVTYSNGVDFNSKLFESIVHDTTAMTLAIIFKNGNKYVYAGVESGTVEKMLKSRSVGEYYNRSIKGKYRAIASAA